MPNPADSTTPLALTFILPTRNRRGVVIRAIESCLEADQLPDVRVEVLILDGNSTDGSFEELTQRYANDQRVRVIRQEGPKGFMPACFQGVPEVRTPFATFMYDDDVLSPFWAELPRQMRIRGADFIMGFGIEGDIGAVCSFQRVKRLLLVEPSALLRAFFGCGHELSTFGLPFSPICCLTRTDRLREWMIQLEEFTRGHPLREHFMMERNAGPDLMIYLYSILQQTGKIVLFDGPVAQFSVHAASITSGLESTDLVLGYWLAQRWLCDQLRLLNRHAEEGWCSAYTVKQGLRLALKRIRRGRWVWLPSFLSEIIGLSARTLAGAGAGAFIKSFLCLLLPRRWRSKFGLSIPAEVLLV